MPHKLNFIDTMARRKDDKTLTRVEMEIMGILWDSNKEGMTTHEIIEKYPGPKPAYSTIATFMKILTVKEYVGYNRKVEGGTRTHVFYPLMSRQEYTSQFMKEVKDSFFEGSIKKLLSFFVEEEGLSRDTLDQLLMVMEKEGKK